MEAVLDLDNIVEVNEVDAIPRDAVMAVLPPFMLQLPSLPEDEVPAMRFSSFADSVRGFLPRPDFKGFGGDHFGDGHY